MKRILVVLLALVALSATPAMADANAQGQSRMTAAQRYGVVGGRTVLGAPVTEITRDGPLSCKSSTFYVEHQNFLQQMLWRFYQSVYWCYTGSEITGTVTASNWATFSGIGGFWNYLGISGKNDTPCSGNWSCTRMHTGKFSLCIGACYYRYPWDKAVIYGSGGIVWSGGGVNN